MRGSETNKRQSSPAQVNHRAHDAGRPGNPARRVLRRGSAILAMILGLSFFQFVPQLISPALAASPLNVFVGYFDTHTVPFSSNQPNPWPYTDPSSFDGTPCPNYPNDTTCWDSSAVRLDNPGSAAVTGVQVVVTMGSKTYALWGSNLTVKANGMLVLTETGSSQNSENFDGSDYPPNAYNGGNTASCANSGAIPNVKITIAGTTTTYLDNGQVLNTNGVDGGHCLNGQFVSGRMDESHPWVQIGASSPVAPSAPQSLAATAGSGSVSLTWQPPANNGGATITGYNIYRGTTPGGEGSTPIATGVTGGSFTDTGLTNGTTYYYTVAAVNSAGVSAHSNEAFATPQLVQATVPGAPTGLTAAGANSSVKLSWTAPSSNGGSPITSYDVYRATSPGGEGTTAVATGVTGTSFTDATVTNGTKYYYTVAAVNAVGVSAQSNEASATPQPTVPGAPTGLVASGGSGQVALSWTTPNTDGGSAITGYNVYRGTTAGGEGSTPIATGVNGGSFTDTTVTNGTKYYYTVAAVNAVGTGTASNEASATPQAAATVPGAPTGLAATGGNASVKLSWTAPASNGGAAITGYDVYRGTSLGGEGSTPIATGVTGTSFTDTGLTNGTAYYYTVAAVNAVGTGTASNEASATPQATVPTAPLGLTAAAGNGSVALSWSVPASNGGSAITGYDVYRGTTAGGEASTPIASNVSGTSYTDTTAANGTKYYYTVAAVNAIGVSAQSNEASATPQAAATVPGAPTGLAATGGNASVKLSWTAPASNGGSAITGYDVYRGTTAGGEASTPIASNVSGTSYTDTTAANGTKYYYTVAAVNAIGVSAQSNEASATPQAAATVPGAPTGLAATGGNASVKLSWTAPASNGGSAITGYDVYRGTTAGGEASTPIASNVSGTSYTDTTAANGTKYYYTVAAVNAIGVSAQSNEASATPQAAGKAAFVRRVGSATASASRTTTSVAVSAPGVVAGHTLVVSLLLSTTKSLTGTVSATDSAGNSYVVARDTNDGSGGDRTVVLVSVGVQALAAGGSITLTYPSSAETHVSVDEFSGITGIDTSAGATGTATAFSSGAAPTTTQATDVLIGTVGIESGKAPTWAAGWTPLPVLSVSSDYLDTSYQMATAAGAYAASGTTKGQWMASIITLKTS